MVEMAVGSAVRDASWGGFPEAHILCAEYGCKIEFYEQQQIGGDHSFSLSVVGGADESEKVCRLVWTGSHFNVLELVATNAD